MINTWTQWNSKIAHERFQSFLKKTTTSTRGTETILPIIVLTMVLSNMLTHSLQMEFILWLCRPWHMIHIILSPSRALLCC